jgi:uncharacterized repeat protein (TIGR01451 family)
MLATNLGQITGVVRNDLSGDGATTVFASGVQVELFRDNGDSAFGTGDTSLGTTTTNSSGAYAFNEANVSGGLTAGGYFVRVNPASTQHMRAGTNVTPLISFDATEAMGSVTTIDTFGSNQTATASSGGPTDANSADGTNVDAGGARDLRVRVNGGTGSAVVTSNFASAGFLNVSSDSDIEGIVNVVWDGTDGAGATVNPTGLAFDATAAGANLGFQLDIVADNKPGATVTIRAYSGAGNVSQATVTILDQDGALDGDASETRTVLFSAFNIVGGTGANFANLGALELEIDYQSASLRGLDARLAFAGAFGYTTKSANFTVLNRMSLGDRVWIDSNNNGLLDSGENGVNAVSVSVYEDTDSDNDYLDEVVLATTTTDSTGAYLFQNLFPGDYIVRVNPTNFTGSGPLVGLATSTGNNVAGTAPDPDSPDANSTDKGRTLMPDGSVVSFAATLIGNGESTSDGDSDNNTNRTLDFGFFGYDVTITKQVDLSTATAGSTLNYTMIVTNNGPTTASGVTFTDTLPAGVTFQSGTTTVIGQSVSGSSSSQTVTSTIGTLASGATATITIRGTVSAGASGTLTNTAVVTAPGENNTNNNTATAQTVLPSIAPASIAGKVYVDSNNNAVFDSNERPIAGVLLTLTGTTVGNQSVLRVTTTDAMGCYEFAGLTPGTYQVAQTQPTFYPDGRDAATWAGAQVGQDVISTITVAAGQNATANNFGELPPNLSKRSFLASNLRQRSVAA